MNLSKLKLNTIKISNESLNFKIKKEFPLKKEFPFGYIFIKKLNINLNDDIFLNFQGEISINNINKSFLVNSIGKLNYNNNNFYFEPNSMKINFEENKENKLLNHALSMVNKYSDNKLIQIIEKHIIEFISNQLKNIPIYTLRKEESLNLIINNVKIEDNELIIEISYKKVIGIFLMSISIIMGVLLIIFTFIKIFSYEKNKVLIKVPTESNISSQEESNIDSNTKYYVLGLKSIAFLIERILR
jgi:hypothetical protein